MAPQTERKRILPPTVFMSAIVLAVLLHFLFRVGAFLSFPWTLIGLLPIAAGSALNLLADRDFKQRETTVKPFETSSALVTSGVFSITRNPMYLGMTLILLGIALLLGSALPLIVVVAAAVVFDRTYISPEEKMLEHTFGDMFAQYRRKVRRWI